MIKNGALLDLSQHQRYYDVELNPKKSVNYQTTAVSFYRILKDRNTVDIVVRRGKWVQFHSV